jgi:hypothetical protein
MLRAVGLSAAAFFFLAAPALAETIARGAHDGMLALSAKGNPSAAFVRGTKLVVAQRVKHGKWRAKKVAPVPTGSRVVAFAVRRDGPVVLAQTSSARTLMCFRRTKGIWQRVRLGPRLTPRSAYGLPGLTFDAHKLPVVAYSRWNSATTNSRLMLARIDAKGRAHTVSITREGFPQSLVPPPATPVLVKGRIHVIESYGYRTVEATIEWYPKGPTWEGVFIDAGRGEFPVGSVFAAATPAGRVYAAWSQAVLGYNAIPVTLAVGGRRPRSKFLVDRGLTTGLALISRHPEVAANEWMPDDPNDVLGTQQIWAADILGHSGGTELDGRITSYAADARGRRNLLLALPRGLSWFRTARFRTHVRIKASPQEDGSIVVSGRVAGITSGRVTLYRERFGASRARIATPALASGVFSFVDRTPSLPAVYRAVYIDPKTHIPYAALLRTPIGSQASHANGRARLLRWLRSFGPVALGGELAVP